MGGKIEIRKCQYSRKKCYSIASPSSRFCTLHEENRIMCRYICPFTHVQCNYSSLETSGFCDVHKRVLDRKRQRYNAFEQKYCNKLPAYKRENEVDFVEGKINNYVDYARYVDLLSRPGAPSPLSNAGIYSVPEIENLKDAANDILRSRLNETRNLYQQRAHSAAHALDEELKERSRNDEKFTVVTNSSAEIAVSLQALIDRHQQKIEELPPVDKDEISHPSQRQKLQTDVDYDMKNSDNFCHYSEIRRKVASSFIFHNQENQKEGPVEEVVQQVMNSVLNILDKNAEPVAYQYEDVCTNQKIKGFEHCFKHLWKEASALKKCAECDSTCTLASNICGKCLKPYLDVKTENMVCFSDDDEGIATVSVGTTDNDLNAVLTECAKKLKAFTEVEKDNDLEITSPHKFDSKNLAEEKRLEFMWGDMLKFGLECEDVTFAKEIKIKDDDLPASKEYIPLQYNRSYDIDKIIATPSDETSESEAEPITFCQEGVKKPIVCRFPSRTLSEKVAAHTDKTLDIAVGIEDPSQLPVQFRPVPVAPSQSSVNTVQNQSQTGRIPRPTYYPTSTANTIRLIKDVNPAARSNHQFLYTPNNRQVITNTFVQNPRSSTYVRPLRLLRPPPAVKYVYHYYPANQSATYIPSSVPIAYPSGNPSVKYAQSHVGPPVTYTRIYTPHDPATQYPPTYRRYQ